MMVAAQGGSTLRHHAASDALELGVAHAAAERPGPEAVGDAVYRKCARLRRVRVIVLRYVGFADRSAGRAA